VLARGYSITMNADTGEVLRSVDHAASGQLLKTRLMGGELKSRVEEV
jgi:exonuclease VII large subunit